MKLYGYWRSSASWRVRIGLAFKGLDYELIPVNLAKGEHKDARYGDVNAWQEVPTLEVDGLRIGQSLVILQYLEDRFPEPELIPKTQPERAFALQICEAVNSSIHPLQNLRVMKKLEADFGFDDAKKAEWAAHFIHRGFLGLEDMLKRTAGVFALGETFTIADCFIVPQIYNARRYGVDMGQFPILSRLDATLLRHPAVATTHPSVQPDAPKS